MTNDDLIRQVATEIRQHHHRGTMEEALDAAKAVLKITEDRHKRYRNFVDFRMVVVSALLDWPKDNSLSMEQMLQAVASLYAKYQSYIDGEDYQLFSTAPQIVEEIIDPEVKE